MTEKILDLNQIFKEQDERRELEQGVELLISTIFEVLDKIKEKNNEK